MTGGGEVGLWSAGQVDRSNKNIIFGSARGKNGWIRGSDQIMMVAHHSGNR